MASNGIRDRVAIVGMGCTPFGERWDRMPLLAIYASCAERGLAFQK